MILFEQQLHFNPLIMQHEHKDVWGKLRLMICLLEQTDPDVNRNSILTSPVYQRHILHQFGWRPFLPFPWAARWDQQPENSFEIPTYIVRYCVINSGENPIGTHDWFPLLISRLSHSLVKTTHFYLDDVSISQRETEFRLIGHKFPILCVCFEINLYILSFLRPAVTSFTCLQDFFL